MEFFELQWLSIFSIKRQSITRWTVHWALNDLYRTMLSWGQYDLAPRPPPSPFLPSANCLNFSVFLCVAGWAHWRSTDREGGRRWRRSQIIRPRESLVLYKSLNTLWTGAKYEFIVQGVFLPMWWHRCKCSPWWGDLDKRFCGSSAWEGDKALPASRQYFSRKPTRSANNWSSYEL